MSSKLKSVSAAHRGVMTRLLNRVNGNPEELLREHNVNGLFTIRDLIRNKEKTIVELDAKFWRRYRKMNSEKKSQKLTGIHLIFK